MEFEAKVTGIPDLKEALASIAPKLRKRALRNALAAGARIVRDTARSRTPTLKTTTYSGLSAIRRGVRKPGTVRQALSVRTSKQASRAGDVGVFVSVRPAKVGQRGAKSPNDPYYWRFINFGTIKQRGSNFMEAGAAVLGQALDKFISVIGPQIEKLNGGKNVEL